MEPRTALDLETTSLDPEQGSILAVGLAQEGPKDALEGAFPAFRARGMRVGSSECLRRLEALLRGPTPLAVHDVRMEGSWSEAWFGVRLTGERVVDTKLLANRVYPGQPANLAALVSRHLPEVSGYKGDTDGLIKAGKILDIPQEDLLRRVAVDAWATAKLVPILTQLLPPEARPWLAEDVDLALCVERMAKKGMPFDEEKAFEIKAQCEATQEAVRRRLDPVNPGSPGQVGELLRRLGLDLPSSTAGNPETGETLLRASIQYCENADVVGVCGAILDYRAAQKLKGTYVEGYARRRSPDGRLRSDLWWPGTFSWRLASSDPNLQNVPGSARGLFRSRDGKSLIESDYGQAELRIAAALAPEPTLLEVFKAGGDPHSLFATRLFGLGFTKDQRHTAKTGNFQLRYGAGPKGFWEMLAKDGKFVELSECRRVHSGFWDGYPGFGDHVERQYRTLRAGEPVFSPTAGYRWTLEDGLLKHPDNEGEALRSVENAVIQCVPPRWALRAALIAEKEGIDIVLNTHDGLIAEVDTADAVDAGRRLGQIMEEVAAEDWMQGLRVPCDVKAGQDWASLKPLPKKE